jgi:hypothetical protein
MCPCNYAFAFVSIVPQALSSSSPSPTPPSTAPRNHRLCRRRPSSPPTSAWRQPVIRLPRPWSSLLRVSCQMFGALMASLYVPSTGKSSNSSSSSSCAPGFCGCSGWLESFESEVTALVVFELPCAAPDILGDFVASLSGRLS